MINANDSFYLYRKSFLFCKEVQNRSIWMGDMDMLERVGITKNLGWGFFGVMLFMMGDGIEAGWLSPFLIESGLTMQ